MSTFRSNESRGVPPRELSPELTRLLATIGENDNRINDALQGTPPTSLTIDHLMQELAQAKARLLKVTEREGLLHSLGAETPDNETDKNNEAVLQKIDEALDYLENMNKEKQTSIVAATWFKPNIMLEKMRQRYQNIDELYTNQILELLVIIGQRMEPKQILAGEFDVPNLLQDNHEVTQLTALLGAWDHLSADQLERIKAQYSDKNSVQQRLDGLIQDARKTPAYRKAALDSLLQRVPLLLHNTQVDRLAILALVEQGYIVPEEEIDRENYLQHGAAYQEHIAYILRQSRVNAAALETMNQVKQAASSEEKIRLIDLALLHFSSTNRLQKPTRISNERIHEEIAAYRQFASSHGNANESLADTLLAPTIGLKVDTISNEAEQIEDKLRTMKADIEFEQMEHTQQINYVKTNMDRFRTSLLESLRDVSQISTQFRTLERTGKRLKTLVEKIQKHLTESDYNRMTEELLSADKLFNSSDGNKEDYQFNLWFETHLKHIHEDATRDQTLDQDIEEVARQAETDQDQLVGEIHALTDEVNTELPQLISEQEDLVRSPTVTRGFLFRKSGVQVIVNGKVKIIPRNIISQRLEALKDELTKKTVSLNQKKEQLALLKKQAISKDSSLMKRYQAAIESLEAGIQRIDSLPIPKQDAQLQSEIKTLKIFLLNKKTTLIKAVT